jgi:beta-ribofuranosylaminobenzene 5'-phosphate synthase
MIARLVASTKWGKGLGAQTTGRCWRPGWVAEYAAQNSAQNANGRLHSSGRFGKIRGMTDKPLSSPTHVVSVRRVEVVAPCRLHFGLLAFGRSSGRQFGGAGVMVDGPAIRLDVTAAERLETAGCLAARAREFAGCWAEYVGLPSGAAEALACRIEVQSAAPEHSGLGVGTQLALSIATALTAWFDRPPLSPTELALSVGRGRRSAIGTYGFTSGGLIVERGRLPDEPISPLECRLPVPDAWRFVLIQPRANAGLSGVAEQTAFDQLPPVPEAVTAALLDELRLRMLPAVRNADFAQFSESVYQYGRLAGLCFAAVQGGPYNGPRLAGIVDLIRRLGVAGVGQSSWGPTLFALLPDEGQAREFRTRLAAALDVQLGERDVELSLASPNNCGASIRG